MKKIVFILISLLILPALCFGAETTGADFLLIGIGARSSAMADSLGIVGDDVNSVYVNPSSLASIDSTDISITHNEWFGDVKHEFLGAAQKIHGPTVLGMGVSYLHTELDGYSAAGAKTAAFSNYDLCASLSVATMFADALSLGASAKVIKQKIEQSEANGAAIDFGLGYQIGKVKIGCAVTNIGPKMKFIQDAYSLPLTLDLGAGCEVGTGVVALDIKHQLLEEYTTVGLGAEQWITDFFAVRAGYLYRKENNLGGLFGFSGGIGFQVGQYYIDYAFVPFEGLGSSQRISLNIKFGPIITHYNKADDLYYKPRKIVKKITLQSKKIAPKPKKSAVESKKITTQPKSVKSKSIALPAKRKTLQPKKITLQSKAKKLQPKIMALQ
jgi:hypothetical protein